MGSTCWKTELDQLGEEAHICVSSVQRSLGAKCRMARIFYAAEDSHAPCMRKVGWGHDIPLQAGLSRNSGASGWSIAYHTAPLNMRGLITLEACLIAIFIMSSVNQL